MVIDLISTSIFSRVKSVKIIATGVAVDVDSLTVVGFMRTNNLFLFDFILYVPSTIFQKNRDRSSRVEPVLSSTQ